MEVLGPSPDKRHTFATFACAPASRRRRIRAGSKPGPLSGRRKPLQAGFFCADPAMTSSLLGVLPAGISGASRMLRGFPGGMSAG
jgi:hypothetical protein